ncbi:MAG: hypothetical protein AAGI30_01115 [Planctomycetota bacterium]
MAVVATLPGCITDVSVRPADPAEKLRAQLDTRLTSKGFSGFTTDALHLLDLNEMAAREPLHAIARLQDAAAVEPDARWRLAAAELLLDAAERTNPPDLSLFLACAHEADQELHRAIGARGGLLDARTEFAADLYRRATAHVIAGSDQNWLGDGGGELVDGAGGTYTLELDPGDGVRRYGPGAFDSLTPTDFVRVHGMRNRHRLDAYGVPVVAAREQDRATPPRAEPFIPPEGMIGAATATLRFDGPRSAVVELWNIGHVRTIDRHGATLRLSTDVTAPIAELYARAELVRRGRLGLTDAQQSLSYIGIYLHEPYDPTKIPVLMVHGLLSSPATWRDMLNDLRADPIIRDRYQFWMFFYPSGLPIPRSAAYLRRSLTDVRAHFDPGGTSPTMARMVLLGHSMGGLLSKAVVQSSGNTLWHSLHPDAFDEVPMSEYVRDHLREVFFYGADEDISRIVFIATPHRGSGIASSWIGRLGDAFIDLPDEFDPVDQWFEREHRRRPSGNEYQLGLGVPSSIDDLREGAPHLLAYAALPIRADLPYHSIAGNTKGDSDGVVSVDSALIEGATSELIVDAAHDAHTHPLAIREVRRILLEHVLTIDRAPSP